MMFKKNINIGIKFLEIFLLKLIRFNLSLYFQIKKGRLSPINSY